MTPGSPDSSPLLATSLSTPQRKIVERVVASLSDLPELVGVVLGGSHARGMARADSDIDLGILYSDSSPLDISALRDLLQGISGCQIAALTGHFEWGPWANGGAWLALDHQRVDLIYRSVEHLERVVDEAKRGEFELHYGQQPPFGFFGPSYLGELSIAVTLADPVGKVAELKAQVRHYPEPLRARVVQDFTWSAEFGLRAFARKYARRGDAYLTASTIARSVHAMTLALFALNRRHLLNDKSALSEAAAFALSPDRFEERVESLLAAIGSTPAELQRSVDEAEAILSELRELAGDLYSPLFPLGAL